MENKKDYFSPKDLMKPPIARAAYSDRTAWLMGKFSELVYLKFEENQLDELKERLTSGGFELVKTFNEQDTQAFLVKCKDFAVLAFRGTEKSGADIKTDLNTRFYQTPEGKMHKGFITAYQYIENQVKQAVEEMEHIPLYITGHSLGGALATVAASMLEDDHIAACYTFGCPRVGTADLDQNLKVPVYRVVNAADGVPRVPLSIMGFVHVGDLRYLTYDSKLIRNPSFTRRLVRFVLEMIVNWKAPAEDHFMRNYVAKLEKVAMDRITS